MKSEGYSEPVLGRGEEQRPSSGESRPTQTAPPVAELVSPLARSPVQEARFRKLSILVPVYNEEHYIEQVLEAVLGAPLPEGMDREVIVVDDASTDRTCQRLRRFAAGHPQVRLFFHSANQGKGAAIRKAVKQSSGDVIVIQDADLEYDPNEYGRLLEPILAGHADVVYGSRFLASPYRRVLYYWHSLGNRFLTAFSNCFTDLNLSDMETCFKMVRASILKTIPIRSNRFGIEPELTAKFAGRGCRIYEVPISYRGRTYNEGKKITWWDGLKAIFTIVYFRLAEDLYPEKYGREIFYSLSNTHRIHQWVAGLIGPWVGQRVLELGAGLGNLTRCLMPRDAYAVAEVDPLCFDFLRNLYSYDRRVTVSQLDVGSPEAFEGLEGKFDTVLCLNMLQSVEDDRLALRNLFRVLQPGGRACLLVPQGRWLYGSLDRHQGYLRRYSRAGLKSKLEEAGFQVEAQFSFNRVCMPAWALHSRFFRSRRLHRIQLKLFDSTIWIWRRLDRALPWPGLSCVAVGKKPVSPGSVPRKPRSGRGET